MGERSDRSPTATLSVCGGANRRSGSIREFTGRRTRKLRPLDAATALDALRVPPGNRLDALKGDRAGQHSIRINDQWRICFRWSDGGAEHVQIVDYH
ncbi:MAG: type II toxin-antitoxin system RelE/ParE family toxin [Micropruina sp.]